MCQGKKPRYAPAVIAAKIITGHCVISAENLSERKAIVKAAITVTPLNCPSTPLAPIFTIFMRKVIQSKAKRSEIIQILCVLPRMVKFI